MKISFNGRASGTLGVVLSVATGVAQSQAQETSKVPAQDPMVAGWAAQAADNPQLYKPLPQAEAQAKPEVPPVIVDARSDIDFLVVVINRPTSLKTVLEMLTKDKGRVFYDERLPQFTCQTMTIAGNQNQVIQQLLEPYRNFIAWGKSGDTLLFVFNQQWEKQLSAPRLMPAPSQPRNGFAMNRNPNYKPSVPPGTPSFEFNGEHVYHVPMSPWQQGAKTEPPVATEGDETPPLAPTRQQPTVPVVEDKQPALTAPAASKAGVMRVPAARNPEAQLPITLGAEGNGYSWGSLKPVPNEPNVVRLTISRLASVKEVIQEIARLDGVEAIFDDKIPLTFMAAANWEGTPDAIIQHLARTLASTIIMGNTKGNRLFVLPPSYLKAIATPLSLNEFSIVPDNVAPDFSPDTPSFEFNGQRVYHVPLKPLVVKTNP